MDELLRELDIYWNASADERFAGEHPKCAEIHDKIEVEFRNMADGEIEKILYDLPAKQLSQLLSVFEDLVDERPIFHKYI